MSVNKLILKQLDKLKVANVDSYDEFKSCYHISKIKEIEYKTNHVYLIKLNNSLLVENNYSINMNNGNLPKYNYMKICINKKLGRDMIYVDAIYYDNDNKQDINEMWSGWLPTQEITSIEEL